MWIKICGITNLADAEDVAESGADAVGLNFYDKSKRFVAVESARTIRQLIAERAEVVGVFVNSSAKDVAKVVEFVGLDTVQFHGDESTELIAKFQQRCPEVKVIRAFRVGPGAYPEIDTAIGELSSAGVDLKAVLVDAYQPGEFGGTGHQLDLESFNAWQAARTSQIPVILAGGLKAENVGAAIGLAAPWGVDTASGVENSPGIKNPESIRSFVNSARAAAG